MMTPNETQAIVRAWAERQPDNTRKYAVMVLVVDEDGSTFDLDAELATWPQPARDVQELAYWQQVAEAAGWELRKFTDKAWVIYEDITTGKVRAPDGAAPITPREAIAAAFGKGE